jgi:hypothetical protein
VTPSCLQLPRIVSAPRLLFASVSTISSEYPADFSPPSTSAKSPPLSVVPVHKASVTSKNALNRAFSLIPLFQNHYHPSKNSFPALSTYQPLSRHGAPELRESLVNSSSHAIEDILCLVVHPETSLFEKLSDEV